MKKLSIQVQKWGILKLELSFFDSIAVICFFFKYFFEIFKATLKQVEKVLWP